MGNQSVATERYSLQLDNEIRHWPQSLGNSIGNSGDCSTPVQYNVHDWFIFPIYQFTEDHKMKMLLTVSNGKSA